MDRSTVYVVVILTLNAVSRGFAWSYSCDCKMAAKGLDYKGKISSTKSGYTCQHWDSQTPNKHEKNDLILYPNAINNEANYCRNPDKKARGPWCYTTDSPSKVRYEYCDIPLCSTCIDYCDPDPCRNGGVCQSHSDGLTCDCSDQCSGSLCEYCVKTAKAGGLSFRIMEETDIDGNRWTFLMRRYDGSLDFANRDWADYKDGFGNVKKEFWLGNEKMYQLTNGKRIIARFDIQPFGGTSRYAEYDEFHLGSESDDYTLSLGKYTGDAGDAMRGSYGNLRDQPFTTSDRDNDNYSRNCAIKYHGGWWYDSCFFNKFTGDYGRSVPYGTGVHWQSLQTGLQYVDIKIREREGFHAPGRVKTVSASGQSFEVVVDTDSEGQDWIVLMRRYDGFVDFTNRKWDDYREGFGDFTTEFWLGNDKMNYLTNDGKYYVVRFDMNSFDGESRYAEYEQFIVGPEAGGYTLSLGEYSGNAGDAMQGLHTDLRHQPFTTSDRDNDNYHGNCARENHGGWWYDACSLNKFTGDYGQTVDFGKGVHWNTWLPPDIGLQYVNIKIREQKVSSHGGHVKDVSVNGHTFKVLTDTDNDGTEWIVLMRRTSGLVDFANKNWADYKDGFGDFLTEFWLGNDKMNYLTNNGKNHIVRFDMEPFRGEKRYAEYGNFDIGPESDGYRLRLGEYSGNAGDAMRGSNTNLRHQRFTTSDRDNDNYSGNCASKYHGGWWHDSCSSSKWTGDYGETVPYGSGIHWQTYQSLTTGLKEVEIKMRQRVTSPYPGRVTTVKASGQSFDVLKETDSAGDKWIVLMRRYDGFVEFANREWEDFKNGFGDFSTEFWLGNDKMYYLTRKKRYVVRFDIMSFSGEKRYAEYDTFAIGPESDGYRLTIGEYSGNAGDAMRGAYGNLENQQFTTSDRDNDNNRRNCAEKYIGGWWYDSCSFSKFTGQYGETVSYGTGIHWQNLDTTLKYVDIKIKPKK